MEYYYAHDGATYGPFSKVELLKLIQADTLVYYDGIDWTRAEELPEFQNYFAITKGSISENPAQEPVKQPILQPVRSTKSESAAPGIILLVFIIIVAAGAIYFYRNKDGASSNENISDVTSIETAASLASSSQAPLQKDVYETVLSARQIDQSQLDYLSLSELLLYKFEILARHGYDFSDQPEYLSYFKGKEWFSPVNNYLVATSDLSGVENYNFNLLEAKINLLKNSIREIIRQYYASVSDRTFDAKNFYADQVKLCISKKNTNPWEINEILRNDYGEYVNPEFEFVDPFEINFVGSDQGINYFTFKFFFKVYRASKAKYQSCLVTVKWGLNSNLKIVYYKEDKIENLTFSDMPFNADSTVSF